MKRNVIRLYYFLRDSFWFLPALMAVGAGCMAIFTVWLDDALGSDWVGEMLWLWTGTGDGGRAVLSVIATAMMTVVSIVYSLTISILSQTSSHYGPRVLRNFTSDRGNQFVLGTFIATFVFCLSVMRTIISEDGRNFIPFISINFGYALAMASLGVLIYYIHHMAQSIQAENLVSGIGADFQRALPKLFPADTDSSVPSRGDVHDLDWNVGCEVLCEKDGYIIGLDVDCVVSLACQHDLLVKAEKRPGDFSVRGAVVLRISSAKPVSRQVLQAFSGCLSYGIHRTPQQDILYSIQQLVEIAAHALSPGVNEPFTAIACINWLGASLRSVADRNPPSIFKRDKGGRLRAILRHTTFCEMVSASFDQIRIYGSSNKLVVQELIRTIDTLVPVVKTGEDLHCLRSYLVLLMQDAEREIRNANDFAAISGECAQVSDEIRAREFCLAP